MAVTIERDGDMTQVTLPSGIAVRAGVTFSTRRSRGGGESEMPAVFWCKLPTAENPNLSMNLTDLVSEMRAGGASRAQIREVFDASRGIIEKAEAFAATLTGKAQQQYCETIESFRRELLDLSGPSVGLVH